MNTSIHGSMCKQSIMATYFTLFVQLKSYYMKVLLSILFIIISAASLVLAVATHNRYAAAVYMTLFAFSALCVYGINESVSKQ